MLIASREDEYDDLVLRHIIPGVGLILLGLIWFVQFLYYFGMVKMKKIPPSAELYQAFYLFLISGIGLMLELDRTNGMFQLVITNRNVRNFQHSIMYATFLMTGIVQFLERRPILAQFMWRPYSLSKISFFISFFGTAIQFFGHPNPAGLEQTMHRQVAFAFALTGFTFFCDELPSIVFLRCLLCCTTGFWVTFTGQFLFKFQVTDTLEMESVSYLLFLSAYMFFFLFQLLAISLFSYCIDYKIPQKLFGIRIHTHLYKPVHSSSHGFSRRG